MSEEKTLVTRFDRAGAMILRVAEAMDLRPGERGPFIDHHFTEALEQAMLEESWDTIEAVMKAKSEGAK